MKRHLLFGSALLALAALPACDAVKVPGFNPVEQKEAPAAGTPATEPAGAPGAGTEQAAPDAVLPDTGDAGAAGSSETGETPTVDRTGEGSDVTGTAPEDGSTVTDTDTSITDTDTTVTPDTAGSDTTEGDSADASPPVTLASINAISCRKEPDTTPTPTVASVAGATEMAEPTVGAAAVNGLAASLSNFPGIVKLEPRNPEPGGAISSGHCGATRIAEHWLVTAAHCVDQPYNELRIIGDAANLRSPLAKITQGELAVCHAGYEGTTNGYANDIALIRLDDDEVAALGDVPIARYGNTDKTLAPANYPAADMAGWGITSFGGQLSPDLLAANIRITAAGPATIYVASQGGAGPCVGDSGGPLYVTEEDGSKTVVGVLSVVEQNPTTGQFCAGDYNGRYTNLQGYEEWMNSVMSLCEADPETCR
ncbi:MAG: trypsin-like serine protease [Hyphomonas sp.]|nr:trypsin-like serine protease [Hyphomonas sp.]MCA8905264.1 trypsin-like serine protease [Hyphomonas sp.]MCB9972283.1 trypsin-like serine protease [Hyphomonas sp.]